MAKVIPILPCVNIDEQCAFYESIGFEVTAKYRAPNAYAALRYEDITLHFWGSKKNDPSANASMVFVEIEDAHALNAVFCENVKRASGKIPRIGMPRITKVRALKEDTRFTLCDPSGNTLYFGAPNGGASVPGRTLDSEAHAKQFALIYDLLHSHENPEKAAKALRVFMRHKAALSEPDMEKVFALAAEIEEATL